MSTIKISQLTQLNQLEANTQNTLFVGVDVASGVTAKFTAQALSQTLYANNALVVGQNPIVFSNTIGQFSGSDPQFIQLNIQNFNANGASDLILTADDGTNSNSYIDLGINNSQWNSAAFGQTSQYPHDGYLVVQGPGSNTYGNLVIGTAVTGANVVFAVGGQLTSNIIVVVANTGLAFKNGSYITFADGTQQSTAASPAAYSQAGFALANTAYSYGYTSNVWLQGYAANIGAVQVNAAFAAANGAYARASAAYAASNTVNGNLIVTTATAGLALTYAQNAYNEANGAVQNTSTIAVSNIIPTTTNTYTLGSATNRWGSVWIAGQGAALHVLDTVTGNDISITVASNVLQFNNSSATALSNNLIIYANTIIANTYAFSNTSNTGVVTQSTNKSTSVTANGTFGQIIMNNATLNAGSGVTFTVNNSYVQHVGDIPMVVVQNPVTAGIYQATIAAVRVGSFDIFVYNSGAGPAQDSSDAIVLNWSIIRVGS
jgi:hypothetical protein